MPKELGIKLSRCWRKAPSTISEQVSQTMRQAGKNLIAADTCLQGGVESSKLLVFQDFPKISSRGPSLPCPTNPIRFPGPRTSHPKDRIRLPFAISYQIEIDLLKEAPRSKNSVPKWKNRKVVNLYRFQPKLATIPFSNFVTFFVLWRNLPVTQPWIHC